MASPIAAPDVVYESASEPVPGGGPDAPMRIEVAMPRGLFDRLTNHDDAPRCRYDEHTGLAEFVAEPGVAHEEPAVAVSQFFGRIEDALADRGHVVSWRYTGALRLLSEDGAFEADASFYLDAAAARAVGQVEDYVDVRTGLPPPTLVVEIDRSRRARHKLGPYFRMGVEEAWTNHRQDGATIWRADAEAGAGCRPVEESGVCPGVTRSDLDRLFAARSPSARARFSRTLARRVADRLRPVGPR
jgi:Uma2 family endonuclease